jgi:hypothetical protein
LKTRTGKSQNEKQRTKNVTESNVCCQIDWSLKYIITMWIVKHQSFDIAEGCMIARISNALPANVKMIEDKK